MPAKYAKTLTVTTAGAFYTPPPNNQGKVRIQNLDGTNAVWLALGRDHTAAGAEADDTVRIGPGEQYITDWLARHHLLAISANVKVLVESL